MYCTGVLHRVEIASVTHLADTQHVPSDSDKKILFISTEPMLSAFIIIFIHFVSFSH